MLKVGERGEADDQPEVCDGRGRCSGRGLGPEGREEDRVQRQGGGRIRAPTPFPRLPKVRNSNDYSRMNIINSSDDYYRMHISRHDYYHRMYRMNSQFLCYMVLEMCLADGLLN